MARIRLPLRAPALLALGLAGIPAGVQSPIGLHAEAAAAEKARSHVLVLDIAADCRTFFVGPNRADTTFVPGRGNTNMVTGKIFPGGTLPDGIADNDPVLPVNGVAPIGDWHHRSQTALPLPPDIAPAYSSTPPVLATFYHLFADGHALVTENWGIIEVNGIPTVLGVVTGGFGRFSGAAGDVHGTILGTNATGCPNGPARFNIRPGSMQRRWTN